MKYKKGGVGCYVIFASDKCEFAATLTQVFFLRKSLALCCQATVSCNWHKRLRDHLYFCQKELWAPKSLLIFQSLYAFSFPTSCLFNMACCLTRSPSRTNKIPSCFLFASGTFISKRFPSMAVRHFSTLLYLQVCHTQYIPAVNRLPNSKSNKTTKSKWSYPRKYQDGTFTVVESKYR